MTHFRQRLREKTIFNSSINTIANVATLYRHDRGSEYFSSLSLRRLGCPVSRQPHATNEPATCCTPCFPPPAQVSIEPLQLSEGASVFLIQTVGFIIPPVCCRAGGRYTPMEGRSCFGITQEESRWPCLGGWEQMVWSHLKHHHHTHHPGPYHPSTPSTHPEPTLIHTLNYSCTTQNPTKDIPRYRYGWWHVV